MSPTADGKLTAKEILEKQEADAFDFEKLLDPYREGGTPDEPIRRTWGTIVRWLLDKHKFDSETIGAAIMLVCLELKRGKAFDGDGGYGSKGVQLVHYIRQTCVAIRERDEAEKVFALLGKKMFAQLEGFVAEQIKAQLKPWWRRIF